jgi:multisubunit Na+/H+ antiporter MnhF subunit
LEAVNAWLVGVAALLPPFAVAVLAGCRGRTVARLVALQLASSLAGMLLIALTFSFDEPAFIDLPLSLALLSLPGTLIIALFLERWL